VAVDSALGLDTASDQHHDDPGKASMEVGDMFTRMRWLVLGIAAGVVADRIWFEQCKPEAARYPWLRQQMNATVNPWLLEHGIPGGPKGEIGTLEHVGRHSGTTFFTPVHPTIHGETVLIPAPLGVGSQWARNVLEAGRARLQLRETLYELDRPELITITEAGLVPPPIAAPFDHLGWRYVRLRVGASVPGTFAAHRAAEAGGVSEPPLEGTYELPAEPRPAERELTPA
jgi:hypothetical protein